MKFLKSISLTATCALLLVAATAFADSKKELEEVLSYDGLVKINVKGIDTAYARPGASLAAYDKIQLAPIEVAFSKDWKPEKGSGRTRLSTAERENIRTGIAKVVQDEFVKALEEKSSYQVVNEADPDVLLIKANVINVYINAPDTMAPGRSRTYTVSAGEMTIVAELFDSETGQVLARVIDQREARNTGRLTLSNSVINASEIRQIATSWARILRDRLDAAHSIGKK